MTTVTEAIYENGALKLVNPQRLKEHQRYRVIVEEIPVSAAPNLPNNPALAAELERRTTVLPDGRRGMNILGLFEHTDTDLSFEGQSCDSIARIQRMADATMQPTMALVGARHVSPTSRSL